MIPFTCRNNSNKPNRFNSAWAKPAIGSFLLLALLQTACPRDAQALTFADETAATNPFFFNNNSTGSSWTLKQGLTTINFNDTCNTDDGPCVKRLASDSVKIASGNIGNSQTTWTSSTGTSANHLGGYLISFSGTFAPTDGATASYFYGSNSGTLGAAFNNISFTLASNETLEFKISHGSSGGYGDLTITNFSATPVPSPLPFAGLGLAALGIYRARRRKAATPK